MEPAFSDELLQRAFRQAHYIHGFLAGEVDKLPQLPGIAADVITEDYTGASLCLMDAGWLTTAWTLAGNYGIQCELAAVQVFFNVGNDLIPLAHHDTVSRHQFQAFNEREVVQAGPGHLAAINFHGVKYGHRSDLSSAGRRPFDLTKRCFIEIVRKFEGQTIFIMMTCTSTRFCVSDIIVGEHNSVNGNILCSGKILQMFYRSGHIFQFQRLLACEILTEREAKLLHTAQALAFVWILLKPFQDIECLEADPPFLAGGGIQQSDRAGGQVTTIFIGLSGAIQQADFQGIEITGMDKSLSSDYQTVLIGDRLRDAADPPGIMGNVLAYFAISAGGRLN